MTTYTRNTLSGSLAPVNNELEKIEVSLREKLDRNPSVAQNNEMLDDLDMNSNRIINYPDAVNDSDLITKGQVASLAPVQTVNGQTGNVSIPTQIQIDNGVVFDNIAEMKSSSLEVGQLVKCKRYYALGELVDGLEFEVVAGGAGVDDGGSFHDLVNGNQVQLIHNGAVNVKQFGIVGNGVLDERGLFSSILNAAVNTVETNSGDVYLFSSLLTITGLTDFTLNGGGSFFCDDLAGCLNFTSCNNLTVESIKGAGSFDRAAWEALTPTDRALQSAFLKFTSCDELTVKDTFVSGYSGGLKTDLCTNVRLENNTHVGVFGLTSLGVVSDPNFGYSIFVRGGSDVAILNSKSYEASGGVLIGLTAPRIISYGGFAKDCHDNGFYGSSCEDSLCDGFSVIDGLQTGVKMRGSRNKIINCTANNVATIAFNHTGIPLNAAIDSQGAVGSGSSIINCTADTAQGLCSIRSTSETGAPLVMRDCEMVGNIGNNINGAGSTVLPIEMYGVKNIIAKNNIVNTFDAANGMYVTGDGTGGIGKGFIIEGNIIANGPAMIEMFGIEDSLFANNKFENITAVTLNSFTGVTNVKLINTIGDNPAKRLDARGEVGNTFLNNDVFVQGNISVQNESYSQGNATDPLYDVSTLVPTRIKHIVSNGTNLYISKGTATTADWVLI